jgi:purine-binding chemotaxis protein CheW
MGLPTKRQLSGHRRGTRKALDTLSAIEQNDILEASDDGRLPAAKRRESGMPGIENGSSLKSRPDGKAGHFGDVEIEPEPKSAMKDMKTGTVATDKATSGAAIVLEAETAGSGDVDDRMFSAAIEDEIEEDTQKDKYLTFRIGKEDFAVSIRHVIEIIVMQKITEVPDTPDFIKGIINLRGQVIPVMDIRLRFHLPLRPYDDRTCVIVVEVNGIVMGLIVDTVNEVVDIYEDWIDPPPRRSGAVNQYIYGMGKIGKNVKILLDIDKVVEKPPENRAD